MKISWKNEDNPKSEDDPKIKDSPENKDDLKGRGPQKLTQS